MKSSAEDVDSRDYSAAEHQQMLPIHIEQNKSQSTMKLQRHELKNIAIKGGIGELKGNTYP